MTDNHVITTTQASFEARQQLALEGCIVEFTPAELDTLGAVTDDIPVSEEDFLTGGDDE
ncbi:hypothetical protein ACIPMZ_21105 [Scandinavium goeteborgense]|uniref:hypothetical protein n=1 Tax=Scandinavium goeteborgense TaxID=1851514 RepID=UPI0037FCC75B